jgi:hypothetical protein
MRISPLKTPPPPSSTPGSAPVAQRGASQAIAKSAASTGPSPAKLDGTLLGADGKSYPAGTPYTQVPSTQPSSGKGQGTLIFVNGMGETPASSRGQAQRIANATGMNVVPLYNATEGAVKDLLQSVGDTFDLGTNKAVDSLADQVYAQLVAGQPVRLMAHSQGGLITSRALTDVRNRLVAEGGMTRDQAQARLGLVGVETMGSAAPSWPDGPKYVHYVNRSDFVATFLGVGRPLTHPGKDAKVVSFGRFNPFGGWFGGDGHDTSTYLKHYVPFDDAARA